MARLLGHASSAMTSRIYSDLDADDAWLRDAPVRAAGVAEPFETWLELEQTYHFVQDYVPALAEKTYAEARAEAVRERAENPAELGMTPGPVPGTKTGSSAPILDNIKNWCTTQGGTDPEYLTARIARDRPDILERMKAGEYGSVRAAALEAGIVRRRLQIPAEPEAAGVYLAKKFSREEWERLVEAGRSFYGGTSAIADSKEAD